MKATMLDEYNSATNGSSAKSNLTNFIHVIQVFYEHFRNSNHNLNEISAIRNDILVEIPAIGRFP